IWSTTSRTDETLGAGIAHSAVWLRPACMGLWTLSILKGIRMPNGWAVTHYLFTYQTGFMKRALWGDLLWRVFGNWTSHYFFLAGVGLSAFGVLVGLLWLAGRWLPDPSDGAVFLLVFGASPALAFAAHIAGYLDEVAYLALAVGILLRRRWR